MSKSTMGHLSANDPTWECDNCGGTWTGTRSEIKDQGWCEHTNPKFKFLMCGDCEQEFAERRSAAARPAA